MSDARDLIAKLNLAPHPEGGWYRETWRAAAPEGERAGATSIYFLLESDEISHWHKVDSTEIWLWHGGDPLLLSCAENDRAPVRDYRLGPNVLKGDLPQYVIPPFEWQAARPLPGSAGYVLVSCIVSPAFEFSGFTLAPQGWVPGHGPADPA
ncbi:cupin domain-containing protein [Altericroceibacterium spongiae]|uniref:Cupin domain-containing protein n=1 Tax=Altericroceibacterium spongiae TaxID=2320269 RepID=A0A420EBY4_9SPHN|nr:cupin domain-containing protein [Altericroceibacterium spongiae]RKF18186.1 cupin domain-containing protein [Altericroceibacterium spongiae]